MHLHAAAARPVQKVQARKGNCGDAGPECDSISGDKLQDRHVIIN